MSTHLCPTMECAMGHAMEFHKRKLTEATKFSEPKPECQGFAWIGQPLNHCDQCGEPFWEHHFTQEIARDSPFTDPPKWEYKPISEEAKSRVRSQYDRPGTSP